jgi:hypothetical protein
VKQQREPDGAAKFCRPWATRRTFSMMRFCALFLASVPENLG